MCKTSTTGSNISSGSHTTLEESPPKIITFLEGTSEEKEKTKASESIAFKALAAEREELAVRLKAAEERERQAKAKLAQGQKEREAYSLQLKSLEKRQKVSDQNQKTLMKSISENKDISMTDFASNMQTNNKKMAKTVKSAQTRKRVSIAIYIQVTDIRDIQLTISCCCSGGPLPEHGNQEKSHKHYCQHQ
jgi:predicted transcriptional regulator